MAAQVGALRVTVGADIRGLQTGMRAAERQVAKSAGTMQRAVKGIDTSIRGLGNIGALSLGGAGLLAGAAAFLKIADAAKSLTAQLKLATAEYGSFEKASKDVRAIAELTRSDLLATADLYAALQRNSGQLGTTQEQVARATQTVAEAFKVSGAATSEQSAATRQLIQAFQSGVLRGDEFNSVMENAPRLARLLADSLGVTVGELRKMAEAGTLTADKLIKAFTDTKFTAGIDEEFRQLPVTFDQAMGQLYNAAVVVFSAFDRGGQFSTSIANFVTDGTEGFTQLEQRAFHFGEQVSDTIAAFEAVRDALAGLKSDGIGAFFGLTDATYGWRDALSDTLGVLDGVANAFANLANAPGNAIRLLTGVGGPPILNPSNMRGRFLDRTNQARVDRTRQQIMGRSVQDMLAEFGLGRKPPPFRAPAGKTKKPKKGRQPPRDRSDDVEFQFAQELRQAQLDVLRAHQALAHTAGDRARIAFQLLDAERASQEAELNERVRKAERDFAEKKITAGALDQVKVQADQLRLEYDQKDTLERQALAEEISLRQQDAIFEASDQRREFAVDALRAADQLATTQADHRRIQLEILDAESEQKRLELEHQKQLAIRNGATAEEIAVIQAKLDNLSSERSQGAASIERGTRNPLEEWAATVPQTAQEITEAFQRIQADGLENLSDALADVITGTKSLKEAAHDMAAAFIADTIKMISRMLILKAITAAFGGGFGGGTTAGDINVNNATLPGFATGGSMRIGGRSGTDKNILSLNRVPIARVNYGERLDISNDNGPGGGAGDKMPPMSFTFHNDFRGSDPSAVAAISARQDRMEAELPSRVVAAYQDARSRFVIRG